PRVLGLHWGVVVGNVGWQRSGESDGKREFVGEAGNWPRVLGLHWGVVVGNVGWQRSGESDGKREFVGEAGNW
nr:hypothetical protein [Tanacetum cinerariifolium]